LEDYYLDILKIFSNFTITNYKELVAMKIIIVSLILFLGNQFFIPKSFVRRSLIIFIVFSLINNSKAQDTIKEQEKVYKLNYRVEIPVTVGLFALNFYGLSLIKNKPLLDIYQINSLDKNDIWAFDRNAVLQTYSHSKSEQARTISDIGLWTSYCLPALLFIDKDIRNDWADILILYFETQAINLNIYYIGGPVFTKRIRPLVYYEETSMEYKLSDEGTTDSFFSGHTSMVAGASFFMAKVLSDYHPELGLKKWLLYTAAIIPPVFVGYYRYKGLMHFPTDIILGTAIGTAVGILIPHLHKVKKNNNDLSIIPFTGGYSGIAISLKF